MDAPQLRDEATRDRVRAASEFLDPSMWNIPLSQRPLMLTNHRRCSRTKVRALSACPKDGADLHSYRADILVMLNRKLRRLTVRSPDIVDAD